MPTWQEFMAESTVEASAKLADAFAALPASARAWKVSDASRSASELVAECILMNERMLTMRRGVGFPEDFAFNALAMDIYELKTAEIALLPRLRESAEACAEFIRGEPNDALDAEIESPWGPVPVTEILSFPYFNMTYHTGQITLIGMLTESPQTS